MADSSPAGPSPAGPSPMGSGPPQLVIRGGLVVTPGWQGLATVEVRDGRISALRDPDDPVPATSATDVVDATGTWVLPGGVDPHVHLNLRLGPTSTRDSGAELSEAALAGGTTSLLIHALPKRGEDSPSQAMEAIRHEMTGSIAAYGMHACIPGWVADPEDELDRCWDLGARTVKLFTTYRGELMVEPSQLIELLASVHRRAGRVLVHAEEDSIVGWAGNQRADEVSSFMDARPEDAELAAVEHVIRAARVTGAPVYFVHLSTPAAIGLVTAARSEGLDVTCETCPHYLLLDGSRYLQDSGELYLCCPPLRRTSTVEALQAELVAGRIDAVGSDHCCYSQDQKALGRPRASAGPMGLPGIQLRNALILDRFVASGRISLAAAVHLLAGGPARLAGLYPRKGCLSVGSDADLVLWEPGQPWQVDSADLAIASDYSPFEGAILGVRPRVVVRAGRVVAAGGEMLERSGVPYPTGELLVGEPQSVPAWS